MDQVNVENQRNERNRNLTWLHHHTQNVWLQVKIWINPRLAELDPTKLQLVFQLEGCIVVCTHLGKMYTMGSILSSWSLSANEMTSIPNVRNVPSKNRSSKNIWPGASRGCYWFNQTRDRRAVLFCQAQSYFAKLSLILQSSVLFF